MLNRTLVMRCQTPLLVHDVTKEHFGFWDFPEREAVRASAETRIDVLRDCVADRLIALYPNTWLENIRFGQDAPLSLAQCDFESSYFLENTTAIVTLSGHALWESEFEPDWGRYWHTDSCLSATDNDSRLYVEYASNAILEDLIRWLPDYFLLEINFGLQEVGCHTLFQHQVATWKILPSVKMITWKVRADRAFNSILDAANRATEGSAIQTYREQMSKLFQANGIRQAESRRVLHRLSNKWDCLVEPGGTPHDTVPVIRARA